jgi:nucleoside-diphosphate-sugar epimerase
VRVFFAGATGVVGRRLIPRLAAAGHVVTGMTRSASKAESVRALGAEPVVADAFDAPAVREAVARARPGVVIHQMTAIPASINPRRVDRDFARTNRLRTEGTDYLLAAARAAGARRFIAQSFGGYIWVAGPPRAVDESEPRAAEVPEGVREVAAAIEYVERIVPAAPDIEGVVLRYGGFYGAGTQLGEGGATLEQIRKRAFPLAGDGAGTWSFVHMEDVADATLLALERGSAGIYNIADDEPAPVREWLPFLAEAIGAPPPRRVPEWLARLLAADNAVALMTRVSGMVNRKAKAELGWELKYPSWRQGFREGLGN